jgi:hypothetical protein
MKPYLQIIRWIARILGSALILLFLIFAIGEGGPNLFRSVPRELVMHLSLIAMLIGILIAWRKELIGGIIIVAGFAIFWIINYTYSHHLGIGPIFPIFPIVGILFLFSSWQTKSLTS